MSDGTETHAYAAFCRACDGAFAVTVDCEDHRAENGREVAKWMKVAQRVERVLITDVRSGAVKWCACGRARTGEASGEGSAAGSAAVNTAQVHVYPRDS